MAKKDKVKLPKSVAGVKIPKEWRKGAKKLVTKAQSPAGRAAIAQGVSLVAGIAAAAAAKAATQAKAAPAPTPAPAKSTPGHANDAGAPAGDAIAQAVGAGVEAVLGRLFPKR